MNRKCPDCPWTGATGQEVPDHRHTRHGVQQVVCPYCPCFSLHQTPSSLKRHIWSKHHGHNDGLLGTGVMYYFAVHSAAYCSIAQDIPSVESEVALRAQVALCRWSDIVSSTESKRLVAKRSRIGPSRSQRTGIYSLTWEQTTSPKLSLYCKGRSWRLGTSHCHRAQALQRLCCLDLPSSRRHHGCKRCPRPLWLQGPRSWQPWESCPRWACLWWSFSKPAAGLPSAPAAEIGPRDESC